MYKALLSIFILALIVVLGWIGWRRSVQLADQAKTDGSGIPESAEEQAVDQPLFVVLENGFGDEAQWSIELLNKAHRQLVLMMDNPDIEPPRGIRLTLVKEDTGALEGYAGPAHIKFVSDQWPREAQRIWILTHELTNLFANHYAGAGGFPSDWWSNGRSPFPVYMTGVASEAIVEQDVADWIQGIDQEHDDQRLYWALHDKYGFKLFADFFKLLRKDGVDLGFVGNKDYPAPDECRSAYTLAYLSIAAGENLAPIAREHGIGKKPDDWDERHAELGEFVQYSISDAEVARAIESRKRIFESHDKTTEEFKRKLADYRLGKHWVADDPN